jgi:hypothetical protein
MQGWIGGLTFGITLMTIEAYFVISRVSRADAAMSAKMKAENLQPTLPPVNSETGKGEPLPSPLSSPLSSSLTSAASNVPVMHAGQLMSIPSPTSNNAGGDGLRQRKTGSGHREA